MYSRTINTTAVLWIVVPTKNCPGQSASLGMVVLLAYGIRDWGQAHLGRVVRDSDSVLGAEQCIPGFRMLGHSILAED